MSDKMEIRKEVVMELQKYLSSKPFGEVVNLWNILQEEVRLAQQKEQAEWKVLKKEGDDSE